MTPTQKAKELIEKFESLPISFPYIDTVDGQCIGSGYMTHNSAIECAIIAVTAITHTERYLLIEWIQGHPVIDGAKYADTKQEIMDYCEALPKGLGVEYTICRIYNVR